MELVDSLEHTFRHAQQVIDGVQPDQYDERTPCEEWTVRDLLEHMIGVPSMMAAATAGEAPAPSADDADPAARFEEAAAAAMAGWRSPGIMDRTIEAGPGPM